MKEKINLPFYVFIISVFIVITAPSLFSEGMVMDGVLYASISRNLANGLGTFWTPHLSYGLFSEFHEHPPLALGLQSLWFKVFGDSIYVERFYSLFTYVLLGVIIVAIWKQLTKSYKTGWIPLLLFFTMLKISWACANNMLENTMSVFIALSILFYFRGLDRKYFLYAAISGVCLFLAGLTKGFVGLYVWGFPFFYWIFNRNIKFGKMIIGTLVIIFFTILPVVLLLQFWKEASISLTAYFYKQVMGSIQHITTVDNRFFILIAVIYHSIPPLVISFTILIAAWFSKFDFKLLTNNYRLVLPFFLLVTGGVLPLTISMKQSGHYAITTYPYIALALGLSLYPFISKLIEDVNSKSKKFKVFSYVVYGFAIFTIIFSIMQFGKLKYESIKVADCKLIIKEIGKDQTINICPEMFVEWSLHGYMARYANISLQPTNNPAQEYLIIDSKCRNSNIAQNYSEIMIETEEYRLYKKHKD